MAGNGAGLGDLGGWVERFLHFSWRFLLAGRRVGIVPTPHGV